MGNGTSLGTKVEHEMAYPTDDDGARFRNGAVGLVPDHFDRRPLRGRRGNPSMAMMQENPGSMKRGSLLVLRSHAQGASRSGGRRGRRISCGRLARGRRLARQPEGWTRPRTPRGSPGLLLLLPPPWPPDLPSLGELGPRASSLQRRWTRV